MNVTAFRSTEDLSVPLTVREDHHVPTLGSSCRREEASRESTDRRRLTRSELELNTCPVRFVPDRYSYLLELELAIEDHSIKNIRIEFNSCVRAELSMLTDTETSFIRNACLVEYELPQG